MKLWMVHITSIVGFMTGCNKSYDHWRLNGSGSYLLLFVNSYVD